MTQIDEVLKKINTSTIQLHEVDEAKSQLENEIAACDDVLQDPESFEHQRREYRELRTKYVKALNRL
jgi:hypothetical protein